jgi:hypothetical protein
MKYVYDDGGRAAAGYKGDAGDCVCRSIAIASERPYAEVYARLAAGNRAQRRSKRQKEKRAASARDGVNVHRKWYRDYMHELGFKWVPTMSIGSGCTVHLADGELPMGRLVVQVSKHYTAVIDGVVRDADDPQRAILYWEHDNGRELKPYEFREPGRICSIGRRCVYGYWVLEAARKAAKPKPDAFADDPYDQPF